MGEQKYNLSYGFKVLLITTYKKKKNLSFIIYCENIVDVVPLFV